jgi:hypothetical protein
MSVALKEAATGCHNDSLMCALDYACNLWPVFPCDPATKQPLTANGFKDASLDEQQIRSWWARYPHAMIGVPTGPRSGMWVLDIDNGEGKDGNAALAALEAEHGVLPETAKVNTPSGGCHYYFKCNGLEVRNRGQLAPGIDVRGDGGYVIVPGSVRSDGYPYEWAVAGESAESPSWLLEKVIRPKPPAKPSATTGVTNQRYVEAAINGELAKLIGTASGRNSQLNDSAFALGQFVGAGELSHSDAEIRLYAAAVANGYTAKDGERAARATIKSGLEAGAGEPRAIPEPSRRQYDDLDGDEAAAAAEQVIPSAANDNIKGNNDRLPVIDPRDWEGSPVPERQWLVHGFIPARAVTLLSGNGGDGKTQLALQLLASSALRTKWLGQHVTHGPGLYFGAEDEAEELHRRLACIVERYDRRLADLHDVRLIPMADCDATLAAPGKNGRVLETNLLPKLKAEAELLRPTLIVLDASADVFGGDEIVRTQARQFIGMLRSQLAIKFDCAVVLLSHPSLTGINTGTGLSGSTAWNNSVRSRLYLAPPKEEGPNPGARVLQVQKSNYGPSGLAIHCRWDDGVYVVDGGPAPDLLNGNADRLFLELLQLFAEQGQNVGVATGTSYAPAKMAKHPKAKGFTKRQLEAAMQRLLDAGRIKNLPFGPPSRQRFRLEVAEESVAA